jgi:hypothetical protein
MIALPLVASIFPDGLHYRSGPAIDQVPRWWSVIRSDDKRAGRQVPRLQADCLIGRLQRGPMGELKRLPGQRVPAAHKVQSNKLMLQTQRRRI